MEQTTHLHRRRPARLHAAAAEGLGAGGEGGVRDAVGHLVLQRRRALPVELGALLHLRQVTHRCHSQNKQQAPPTASRRLVSLTLWGTTLHLVVTCLTVDARLPQNRPAGVTCPAPSSGIRLSAGGGKTAKITSSPKPGKHEIWIRGPILVLCTPDPGDPGAGPGP